MQIKFLKNGIKVVVDNMVESVPFKKISLYFPANTADSPYRYVVTEMPEALEAIRKATMKEGPANLNIVIYDYPNIPFKKAANSLVMRVPDCTILQSLLIIIPVAFTSQRRRLIYKYAFLPLTLIGLSMLRR